MSDSGFFGKERYIRVLQPRNRRREQRPSLAILIWIKKYLQSLSNSIWLVSARSTPTRNVTNKVQMPIRSMSLNEATYTTSDVTDLFCTKWRTNVTRVGLFQKLNAVLSAVEFEEKKHTAMLKKAETTYLAEKIKTQNLVS